MNNAQIEHIIRASTGITGRNEVVIIGSQAILASYHASHLPNETTMSIEADVLFLDDPDGRLADLVDGAIGELSPFHDAFGIYAQGVGEDTAILPPGWLERLVPLSNDNTGGGIGLCLEPYDLCCAKLMAFRDKDTAYVSSLIECGMLNRDELVERIRCITGNEARKQTALSFLGSAD
jgi:hypothetical protein